MSEPRLHPLEAHSIFLQLEVWSFFFSLSKSSLSNHTKYFWSGLQAQIISCEILQDRLWTKLRSRRYLWIQSSSVLKHHIFCGLANFSSLWLCCVGKYQDTHESADSSALNYRLGSASLFKRLKLPQECCFRFIIALGNYGAAAPDWK